MRNWPWSKNGDNHKEILEDGWQFYHRPTTLDPVGTVFRIDKTKKRFVVDELVISSKRGSEAEVKIKRHAGTGIGIIAKLLDLGFNAHVKAKKDEKVEFELVDPERESTMDVDVDKALEKFMSTLDYKTENRYFLIRDCRYASAMNYRVSKDRVIELGGEEKINDQLTVGGKIKSIKNETYEIPHKFSEKMRVMFLADEIKPDMDSMSQSLRSDSSTTKRYAKHSGPAAGYDSKLDSEIYDDGGGSFAQESYASESYTLKFSREPVIDEIEWED